MTRNFPPRIVAQLVASRNDAQFSAILGNKRVDVERLGKLRVEWSRRFRDLCPFCGQPSGCNCTGTLMDSRDPVRLLKKLDPRTFLGRHNCVGCGYHAAYTAEGALSVLNGGLWYCRDCRKPEAEETAQEVKTVEPEESTPVVKTKKKTTKKTIKKVAKKSRKVTPVAKVVKPATEKAPTEPVQPVAKPVIKPDALTYRPFEVLAEVAN